MKNFYTNRNFNFIKLFTRKQEVDFKLRFNQDIFNQREFNSSIPHQPVIHTRFKKENAGSQHRTAILDEMKTNTDYSELKGSHFAWHDSELKIRRVQKVKRLAKQ